MAIRPLLPHSRGPRRTMLRRLDGAHGFSGRHEECRGGCARNGQHVSTSRSPCEDGATLDHIIAGRLIMGIGAAWFELEHNAYGIPFYTIGERIRRLDEAVAIIKSMWTAEKTTIHGRYYQVSEARCEPKPIRKPHPPFMIGGAGEKLTLRVVAKHADIWNTFGSASLFRSKLAVLREHCSSVGRNMDEIEIWAG